MIRIIRGPMPPGLKRAAPSCLEKAIVAFNSEGAPSDALRASFKGYGSKATKRALFRAQHGKCAWCERTADFKSANVEHYRPKGGSLRHLRGGTQEMPDPAHYWWLAWEWTNLLFACGKCNGQGNKGNYFPLMPGSPTVAAPVAPIPVGGSAGLPIPRHELPALLDPAGADDPIEHLEWAPVDRHLPKRDWTWQVIGRTPRGSATIQTLVLGELAEDVRTHARTVLLPSVEEVAQHLASARKREAGARWDQLIADTFDPKSTLSGFSFYALDYLMPPKTRQAAGLQDPPRPGAK